MNRKLVQLLGCNSNMMSNGNTEFAHIKRSTAVRDLLEYGLIESFRHRKTSPVYRRSTCNSSSLFYTSLENMHCLPQVPQHSPFDLLPNRVDHFART